MPGLAVVAAAAVIGLAVVALRGRWAEPLGRVLRWDPDATERNSRVVVMAALAALAGATVVLLVRPSTLDKELAALAAGLAASHVDDLAAVHENAPAAKRLAALLASSDPDELRALADSWLSDLEAKETSVRTAASYRLWICAWLLRKGGDPRGDELAVALWKHGDFIRPSIKDVLRTVAQLAAAVDDPDPLERRLAARILGDLGDRTGAGAAALAGALDDADAKVREYAAASLGRIGDTTHAPAIAKLLADPERDVRSGAADALGLVGTAATVPALRELFLREDDWQVRSRAVRALGRIGDAATGPTLVAALSDPHEKVRAAAVTALKRVGPSVAPLLEETLRTSSSPEVMAAAREVLFATGRLPTPGGGAPGTTLPGPGGDGTATAGAKTP